MDRGIKLTAFANGDQQAALAIIDLLSGCQTRNDFNQVLKTALIPLVECSGAFYVHMEGEQNTLRLLDSINRSSLSQPTWNNFLELVFQDHILERPVTGDTHVQLVTNAFCYTDPDMSELSNNQILPSR